MNVRPRANGRQFRAGTPSPGTSLTSRDHTDDRHELLLVVPLKLEAEIAAEADKSRAAHPFHAVIDMITRSASSHLRDKARRSPFDTRRKGNRREHIGLTNTRDRLAGGRSCATFIMPRK
jgi:hypothetical protein